jgi:AcrR family transcriptional regulator
MPRGRPSAGAREAIVRATAELFDEQGLAKLTTKEVAKRAGVSDASVYYHFKDKAGLLQAVIEDGLASFKEEDFAKAAAALSVEDMLRGYGEALETYFDSIHPIVTAMQADHELRDRFRTYMTANDMGPHRGIRFLSGLLEQQQKAGRVRADADTPAVALLLQGAAFQRSAQRRIMGRSSGLPSMERTARELAALLVPVGGERAAKRVRR